VIGSPANSCLVVPFAGGVITDSLTSVCSYAGPVSVQATAIVTGVFAVVVAALSGQTGRASGAQSGLPSKSFPPSSWARSIGIELVLSARSITSFPLPNTPVT
jgi:hypothetical protein